MPLGDLTATGPECAMPIIPPRTIGVCLTLLGALLATSAFGQYQDTSSESARGFSNSRVQANISDQGSGYSPIGPYGTYYSRPITANQGRSANWRQQGQVDGLPNPGLALPSDEFLLNWYLLRGPRRSAADLGVTWTPDDGPLVVADLTADGELERVGLEVGDEIARVDRQSVHRRSDWQRIVDSLPAGKEVVIIVHRKGDIKALFWTPSAARRAERSAPETQAPAGEAESPQTQASADEQKSQQTQASAGEEKSQQTQAPVGEAKSQPIKFITAARFRRGPDGRAWLGMVLDNQIADRATVASIERDSAADQGWPAVRRCHFVAQRPQYFCARRIDANDCRHRAG